MFRGRRTNDDEDWRPLAGRDAFERRAVLLRRLREFFHERGVLEVETPLLGRHTNPDPALTSLPVLGEGQGVSHYLQTSPEFAMKRLLAAGSGPIYQVCKAFRGGERGRRHNPEFTILEWYRPGFSYHQLMDEVVELVRTLVGDANLPEERFTYGALFGQLGIDPHRAAPVDLKAVALTLGVPGAEGLDLPRDGWLDLLLTQFLEADLGCGRLSFVYDYPESQASLARLRAGQPPIAERFELYWEGMELANGFHELTDPAEQRCRFIREQERRYGEGQEAPTLDEWLLAALASGLPECAGVALGLDRLLMVMSGAAHIDQVLAFPWERI